MPNVETLISVDIEASGPSPGTGSLISIGACLVHRPDIAFYVELRPEPDLPWDEALEGIHHLTRASLAERGESPPVAAQRWATWIDEVSGEARPIFVSFNAPFDWMFVADLFHRYLARNPFGVSAVDLKAVYLGRHGIERWSETTRRHIARRYPTRSPLTHNALDDARSQAELATLLLPVMPRFRLPRSGRPGR